MMLLRPNEKANAILMAEGIKEVHAMIEPTLNLLLNSSIPLVGVEPRAGVKQTNITFCPDKDSYTINVYLDKYDGYRMT